MVLTSEPGGHGLTDLTFDGDLSDLDRASWRAKLAEIATEHGSFADLGPDHMAAFIDDGTDTLIVSFESITSIRKINPDEEPRGWSFVRDSGWSCLSLISEEDTWFRDPAVYAYFDRLIDDGFFDDFGTVIFTGTGPGGYAAAAFSVAAPGARVLALQPQATLDPAQTGWDGRFRSHRRLDFTSRYGYAPDMVEAASKVVILHDPGVSFDSVHAALFRGPNVLSLRTPRLAARLDRHFDQMNIMEDLIEATAEDALSSEVFARLWRRRQRHLPYLRGTLQALESQGKYGLAAQLCRYVVKRTGRPMFQRKLDEYAAAGHIPAQDLAEPAE